MVLVQVLGERLAAAGGGMAVLAAGLVAVAGAAQIPLAAGRARAVVAAGFVLLRLVTGT